MSNTTEIAAVSDCRRDVKEEELFEHYLREYSSGSLEGVLKNDA